MNRSLSVLLISLALFTGAALLGCQETDPASPSTTVVPQTGQAADEGLALLGPGGSQGSISAEEEADLLFMREEEKLARDVYTVMYERWGHQIFLNISQSEEVHMASILTLLERYAITDPVADNGVGVFTEKTLQDLYDQLIDRGNTSLEEALRVGILIEETDIADLNTAIARTDNRDIVRGYTNLAWGSQNHLRAFTGALANYLGTDRAGTPRGA